VLVAEAVGAALLIAGQIAGLYVAAVAMIVLLAFMISGAWLLTVGVSTRHPQHQNAPSTRMEP
jgi:low affinity Fe/Cu permease